eukprot:Partr_v1_DN28897_c2_g1_i2_m34059 putative Jumonji domain containing 7
MEECNRYSGFHPQSTAYTLDRISPRIEPSVFFRDYISTRKPCIIDGYMVDDSFTLPSLVKKGQPTVDELVDSVKSFADATVMVEQKSDIHGTFGTAEKPKLIMDMRNFAKELATNSDLYLTTQYRDFDDDDNCAWQSLLPSPVNALLPFIPIRPQLMANLIPSQLNLWIGKSEKGTSSGLHHDYHDNLYVLLEGNKKFILFSPSDAKYMYLNGIIKIIGENGLIFYDRKAPIDGLSISSGTTHDEETTYDEESPSDHANLPAWEGSDSEKIDWTLPDDYDADSDADIPEPYSFSQVPTKEILNFVESEEVPDRYGLLAKTTPIVVSLEEGEMLYLPASWFHLVVSSGTPKSGGSHCALNYWLYPPDKADYHSPYTDPTILAEYRRIADLIPMSMRKNVTPTKRKFDEIILL